MSDDELEKLANAMKNVTPSKAARKAGMAAAMAAFDAEFETVEEKISNPAQGLEAEPRPTGQSTGTTPLQTFGRDAMRKLTKLFDVKPQTLMMGGSCAVALFAAALYTPNTTFEERPAMPAPESVAADVGALQEESADADDTIVVTTNRAKRETVVEQEAPSQVEIVQLPPPPAIVTRPEPAPQSAPAGPSADAKAVSELQGGINSVSDLLSQVRSDSSKSESESRDREAKFRQRRDKQANLLAPTGAHGANSADEYRALLEQNARATGQSNEVLSRGQAPVPDAGFVDVPSAPMVTKEVTRRVIKTPASTQERVIPPVTKMQTRRVQQADGTYKTFTETVVVQEASTELVTIPPTYETITETVLVPSHDKFEPYDFNPVTPVDETPVSTFSIDVDTASYSFFRSSINRGQLPPRSSIRLEEMINYFPYDYTAPTSPDEPFKANVTVTETPWNADTKLMHIGIKGYVPQMDEKPRSNIVFLIDTSGSMNQANKLPLLISSFKLLLSTLDEDDTVSIVTYAGRAGTVLEPTPASDMRAISDALTRLRAGGSTAGAAGLQLAYQKAQENFDEDGVNRVILATDGDFNVGFSSHQEMKSFIEKKRETGIFLSVLGFGQGNYNDQLMQSLAQNGNGVAAYIDNLAEANKVLANEAGSALITIAKDVKIQVEFNPETISEYRLIGYETRALKREDFNNDKVDAGEINSGHTVTAIYEMTPVDSPAISNDPLRYIQEKVRSNSTGSDEYAFVKIRHKLPNSDTSTLQTFPIGKSQEQSLKRASDDTRFAAAVAAVGQKLRGDTHVVDYSYADAIALASSAKGEDKNGYRSEFIQLVKLAEGLEK